jgi:hypothetical protein
MTEQRYSREEVDAILGRAVERERGTDDLSREQLVAIAQEIGVSPESIDRAIGEIVVERSEREELVLLRRKAWRGFVAHLIPYVGVNGLLVILNLLTTRFPWAMFPLLGWGIGLLSHLWAVAAPNPELLPRRLQREHERERRRQIKRQVKAGAKELEVAVGQGVAALLHAAANRVTEGANSVHRPVPPRVRIDENGPSAQQPNDEQPRAETKVSPPRNVNS